ALATNPRVLLCDEATSALDPKTTQSILELIRQINRDTGITVIVITHQMSVVQEICNRVAILEHGHVVEEGDVSQVFSRPKAAATRALVFPDMSEGPTGSGYGQLVRLIFEGSVTIDKPLIGSMAIECGIAPNILGASTRTVGQREYGYMLLEIPGGPDEMARAIKYLSAVPNVTVMAEMAYEAKEAAQ
ncbi:MAG: methionine ABC transporter ATP-binding protein, partial [Clostridia bacterium]|nr:methionine ABC transporter ATP-binding protein [Clostridia bacterium]